MALLEPLSKGVDTSEGKLTIAAVILGTLLEAVGTLLTHEQTMHPSSSGWAVFVVVAGALLQVCTVFGYTKGRSLVKQQALMSGLQAGLPFIEQLAEGLADKLIAKGTPPPPVLNVTPTGNLVAAKPPPVPPVSPR